MARYWLNVFLFRVFYPIVLTKSIVWRPCGLSMLYMILALISPMIPVPSTETMNGVTGYFLMGSVGLTFLASLTQLTFHIVLFSTPPYGHILQFCGIQETILRHIGLVRLDKSSSWEFFYWLIPEVTVFPLIFTVYIVIKRATKAMPRDELDQMSIYQHETAYKERNNKIIGFIGKLGTYIVLAALCCVACFEPSLQGGFYFLVFILSATWWALNRELRRGFAFVCRLLMFVVAVHLVAILTYQTQWPQELVPVNSTWARYFGLIPLYVTNCTCENQTDCADPREVLRNVTHDRLTMYPYMVSLFFLYFLLALQSKFLFQKQGKERTRLSVKLETLDTPLSRHVSIRRRTPSQRWQSARRKARRPSSVTQPPETSERTPLMRFGPGRSGGLLQDSTGSVIVQDGHQEDTIQMSSLEDGTPEEKPGFLEHVIMVVFSVYQLLITSCYLAMNIIMMTWSIMYHSWTTFILLLWALILWMVPNKRESMMKWSPFIVFYSTLLLVVQYVFSMNLTDEELPPFILIKGFANISMADLGFKKRDQSSFSHLLVISLFMTVFWITMRQYMVEKMRQRRSSTMRDMVAPLHVSVSTATAAMQTQAERELKNKLMESIGAFVKTLFTKFWIVVVAVMLFTSGITGDEMTVFRIVYMSLFLLFIITFQISWELWRKMMYAFWIAVIGYSVIMLILVYTYQFPAFKMYWKEYLQVSEELQKGIGLIKYETKDLFVRLLTPTFFVIISVLQIHYFHKDFLEVSDLKKAYSRKKQENSTGNAPNDIQVVSQSDVFVSESTDVHPLFNFKAFKHMSKLEKLALLRYLKGYLYSIYNNTWLFLEIHMQKIVLISFVLLCINDVCAINFFFLMTVVVAINLNRFMQILVIKTMSVAIAILMITKMLYQIEFFKHDLWHVNCTNTGNHTLMQRTNNTAEWVGFRKIDKSHNETLSELLKGYIIIIVLTTLRSIILVRQWFYRAREALPLETPLVMFPHLTRADADKGIISFIKFMFNFGFYKFGLEICLIFMVLLIGTRLDFSSVVFSLWLISLYGLKRTVALKVWPVLKMFVIVMLPVQYACVVAPPPWLCFEYPWILNDPDKSFLEWMFLPNTIAQPAPHKLLYDFLLLLLIASQSVVFSIEYRSLMTDREFVAGHNYSVYHLMDTPNFVNPMKDFVSEIHNYLDVFKRGVMMSLMWVTLSIMFLAGTKRTNLFSLGYLIGAFVFLWQGNDYYLLPVRTVLKRWNILIGYNVLVIFCKSIFQGVGCIYIQKLTLDSCWLVQLLGIACLKKFTKPEDQFVAHNGCEMDREDIGMFWDGLCFAFLIFQKRLFRSYYFFHIVDETKAMSILASRGAELLEELHQKRIIEQENHEKAILQKIKAKMEKIKATQRKIQGPVNADYKSHKIDEHEGEAPLARTSSMSTCISSSRTPPQGYQTPIDDDDDEDEPRPLTPQATSSLLQAPSPNSAVMTVSLDTYLDPQRISFGSPPDSELNPRVSSPDETFPVFSPPPYDRRRLGDDEDRDGLIDLRSHRRQSSWAGSMWTGAPRRSIISTTSRSIRSHHTYALYSRRERPMYAKYIPKTYKEAIRSGDYYMFDDMEDDDLNDVYPDGELLEEKRQSPLDREYQPRKMTVGELMNAVLTTDVEVATHVAMYGGSPNDALKLRRRSVPLTRKPSAMSRKSACSDSGVVRRRRQDSDDKSGKTPLPDESEDEVDEDLDSKEESEPKISISTYFKFVWAFFNSIMVSLTNYLNHFSSDYRYIRKVLTQEKELLKATPDFRKGTRLGITQMWQPLAIAKQRSREETEETETSEDPGEGPSTKEDIDVQRKESSLSVPYIRILAPSMERGLDLSSSSSELYREEEEEQAQLSEVDQPPIIQLAASIWFGILAHSSFVCYFMVFVHQIKNASVLSTPLPLMVFLWGSLTIPRPTKTFWITMVAYIEVIVIIKCICQPAFLSWNRTEISSSYPFEVSRILGVERKRNYAFWDLLLLLVIFFHRLMLKSLGQWTAPKIKSRRIIPAEPALAVVRKPEEGQGDDGRDLHVHPPTTSESPSTSHDEIIVKTPEGRILSIQPHSSDEIQEKFARGDYEELVVITGTERSLIEEDFGKALKLTIRRYLQPMFHFFKRILDPSGKERTNVYAYMFLCDFFNFLLSIFGFSSFGALQVDDGGVTAYFQENRVPMPFLLMLLLQFALIVTDRALFLKKSIFGKLIFQYILIIGLHLWMFFVLPSATERQFNARLVPQIWYMVKCFYLLLSAYQLRQGYPTRILGNFLCKKFSVINYVLFKGFMTVPFLFEMRAVMDWIWTDTSMSVMDWFKMEDIFATIFQIKCMRGMESDYPQPRGIKKQQSGKYLVGGGALLLMIGMIWFPLLLFAVGSTVGESNLPQEVTLTVKIGSYEPIYTIAAEDSSFNKYSTKNYEDLRKMYEITHKDRAALTFLDNYINEDIVAVQLSTESSKLWGISPPDKERLKAELNSENDMTIHVDWTITRKPASKEASGVVSTPWTVALPAKIGNEKNPTRINLLHALGDKFENDNTSILTNHSQEVLLKKALPMFLKVTARGSFVVPQLAEPLVQKEEDKKDNYNYRDVTLVVRNTSHDQQYFGIHESCNDTVFHEDLNNIPWYNCSKITMFLFNDKKFPEGLSFISGLGIFGLYTTAVILVGSFIKKMVSDQTPKIMFEDLPYVDRILRLCLNIYLVRESGDLYLEEDLFAKLIFLFRSPETLIRWSRPPEPNDEEESTNENYDEIDDDDNDGTVSSVQFKKKRQ